MALKPEYKQALEKIKALIDKDIRQHYTIPFLAGYGGINELILKEGFKRMYGKCPFEYLFDLRISTAKDLIEQGMPIKKVALQVGYTRQTNFGAAFRRSCGMTPGMYKTHLKNAKA